MDKKAYDDLTDEEKKKITRKKTIVAKGELLTMDDAEAFSLTDFFNVLLHELGHSVGLQHTDDLSPPVSFGNNVMDPFYTFGSAEFEWGPSDIEQLQIRYPNNF